MNRHVLGSRTACWAYFRNRQWNDVGYLFVGYLITDNAYRQLNKHTAIPLHRGRLPDSQLFVHDCQHDVE